MNANYRSIISAISLIFALAASISAAPADLDPTFGNGGIVITNRRNSNGNGNNLYAAHAMAIQPDGKIVVVGEGFTNPDDSWDFAVVRYNPDGSLDNSFGGGIVNTRVGNSQDVPQSVAIQTDGKIVVVGGTCSGVGTFGCTGVSFAVVRYNPDGSLDTSFNGTGIVSTPVGNADSGASDLAIQADGKIVVAGSSGIFRSGSTNRNFAIVRYNADGSLDTSFNSSGKVITPVGGASSVALQADGKIVAAGSTGNLLDFYFVTVRYNPDGSLDTSLNGTGIVITPVGGSGSGAADLAIQADGKIVVAGDSLVVGGNWRTADFAIVRYNPDGSLDTSFGGTGKILIPDSDSADYASSIAIQPNGKIIVAGYSYSIVSHIALVRLNPNGSLDTSFNGTGTVTTSVSNAGDTACSVTIQADGKIVVAGDSGDDLLDFVVVRYQGDAPSSSCSSSNPIDCPDFFVRQHYRDFLAREAEQSGLDAWLRLLADCPTGDAECFHQARLTTSASFFGSPEFQLKGYFVFRFYKLAFNRLPEYGEITADMQQVTGQTPADVYANKVAFANSFGQRAEFINTYGALSNAAYVTALLNRYQLTSITTPDPANPDGAQKVTLTQADLVARLDSNSLTRAQVLRAIADSDEVFQLEFNRAFVAMQYYGYLRRKPEAAGYQAWLNYLTSHPTDFREMVRGFVDSTEYRRRFGQP